MRNRALRQHADRPLQPRNIYSTGWGEQGDRPSPMKRGWEQLKRDAREIQSDLQDEPDEVAPRLKRRLDWYIKGQ